jgi:putative PIN family toxin of toxin-antitoxin system
VRVVLDANVLVAAAISPKGVPSELIRRWADGGFDLIVSEQLLGEVGCAFRSPKIRGRLSDEDAREIVSGLREEATHVADVVQPQRRTADPHDDYLVALAEAHGAVLVSGDRHLLELADRFPILSPRDFLNELE